MKELILIDDDDLVRMTWEFKAQAANVRLHCFQSGAEFLKNYSSFEKNVPIYLDSDLGQERGEDLAIDFINLGFSEIHLVTGKQEKQIKNKEIFKSIRGKEPPF